MLLVEIAPPAFDVEHNLIYATDANFTGAPVYRRAACYLHVDAADALNKAIALAAPLGLRLRIYDAYRPSEAQWALWNHTPEPGFLVHPSRGSPHSRGVAVDLDLVDAAGRELEMGTPVDENSPLAWHGSSAIPEAAQRNRLVLLGLMTAAGWDFYGREWWHYQLFDARRYPLLSDTASGTRMM